VIQIDPNRLREVSVWHYKRDTLAPADDAVAAEEPFEIQVDGRSIAVIMRTPGHDLELAAGFLLSEGVIADPEEIQSVAPALDRDGFPERNVLDLRLRPGAAEAAAARFRPFLVTSSCGLCGAVSVEQVCARAFPVASAIAVAPSTLLGLAETMRAAQPLFARTGGLHAAALFLADGRLVSLREDVGRHNAVDKVVGRLFLDRELPASHSVLQVSGRTSFELVQKAATAGIPILTAVGAPSSLAVETAERVGLTLVGMVRDGRFNVYSHPWRIAAAPGYPRRPGVEWSGAARAE
jgi:FdhD protein